MFCISITLFRNKTIFLKKNIPKMLVLIPTLRKIIHVNKKIYNELYKKFVLLKEKYILKV